MSERWYQNRGVQASIIGAVVAGIFTLFAAYIDRSPTVQTAPVTVEKLIHPASIPKTNKDQEQMRVPSGKLLVYATSPGQFFSGGQPDGYSLFTEALVKHITLPDVPALIMLNNVSKTVYKTTNGDQQPYVESSAFPDDFHFRELAVGGPTKGIALVIGNAEYSFMPIPNAANDARIMAATLKLLGMEVTKKVNVSKTEMIRAIMDFNQRLKESTAVGLFYYSGHAFEIGGQNYLMPIGSDAEIDGESSIIDEGVKVDRILKSMEHNGNASNIIILDVTRGNPFMK